jgi:hypothetical protein
MAQEMNSGFGMSTGWKDITLQCWNKEGGGGFTVDNDTGNPDNGIPQAKTLTGDFGIADHGAPKCDRVAKALVAFRSPKSENIHWSLDCKFQNNSGVVATQPHPDGGLLGGQARRAQCHEDGGRQLHAQDRCALRSQGACHQAASVRMRHAVDPYRRDRRNVTKTGAARKGTHCRLEKAEVEKRRKALAAAQDAAKRKRLLKLRQDRAGKVAEAAAHARANALRALSAKRTNKMKVAPWRRSTTTARLVNSRRIMGFH